METKLKCLVIDDEPIAVGILEDYIAKISFLEHAGSYRSALKTLEYLKEKAVDLIFLDIKMPDLSGIQFLKSLDKHPLVVFTTAYSEFAVESYDFQAVDYLLKPIEFERFLQAANRAIEHFLKQEGSVSEQHMAGKMTIQDNNILLLKSGLEYHPVVTRDIFYIEGAGNYSQFITKSKNLMVLMNLKDALKRLPNDQFYRIHRSYIVNINSIDTIGKDHVKIGEMTLPIGDTYKDPFFTKLRVRYES